MLAIALIELKSYISSRIGMFWLAAYPVIMLVFLIGLFDPGIQTVDVTDSYHFRTVVGLVTITIITTALYGTGLHISAMRNHKSLLPYLFLPVSIFTAIIAILISRVILVFVYSLIFLVVSFIVLDISLELTFYIVFKVLISFLVVAFFSFSVILPLLLVSKSFSTFSALANILNFYAIFSSDVFIPIRALPEWGQFLVTTSPFYYLNIAIKNAFSESTPAFFWISIIFLFLSSIFLAYFSSRQRIMVPVN